MSKLELIILISPIMLAQSIFLFMNAKKRGSFAWFWGIWGLIQFPLPLIFYWFFVVRRQRNRDRKD
ncbi:transcriptional regulator [Lederbergia graminis]|uniref:Transcriptional regulator n=1 Tax=Lederbergia graminis TaxID=735518 RepID=A0ABW0LLM4_9BACI|nr:transcriptional regulator [Paenibacillus bovis]